MNAPVNGFISTTSIGPSISALTDIYQDAVNLAVWQRTLNADLQEGVDSLIATQPGFQRSIMVSPSRVIEALGAKFPQVFAADLAQVVDVFCCLF